MEIVQNLPLISVIIPAYNAEKTIERACRSVLEQPYGNVELVVVDDGSADKTAQVVNNLALEDVRIKLICQDNFGVCKARNVGMENAAGEYLFFLDSDDALTADCLTHMHALAVQYNADIVVENFLHVFPDGAEEAASFSMQDKVTVWGNMEPLSFALKDHPATHSACAKLYRSAIAKAVRFEEGKRIHEDGFYVFEVSLKQPRTVIVDEPVVRRYFREKSLEKVQYSEKYYDMLYFGKKKHQIIEENHPELLPLAKNIMVKAALATLNTVRLMDDPRVKPLEKEAVQIVRKNAAYFIPASKMDQYTFWIVKLGLSKAYKYFYRFYLLLRKSL